uniref:Protein transporter Sec61 subunit beta-like protein n=1 Tax=Rhizophora mucronata TaxID=61149 RepID=A0A2P2LG87_RHIMU
MRLFCILHLEAPSVNTRKLKLFGGCFCFCFRNGIRRSGASERNCSGLCKPAQEENDE